MRLTFRINTLARLSLIFAVIWLALAAAALFGWRRVSDEVGPRAQAEASLAVSTAAQRLAAAERSVAPAERLRANALRGAALAHGQPRIETPAGGGAPGLVFGHWPAGGGEVALDEAAANGDDVSLVLPKDAAPGPQGFSGGAPVRLAGRVYFAWLEPVVGRGGEVLGVYGGFRPFEAMEDGLRQASGSPSFNRGFLAILDRHGAVLLTSENPPRTWLARHAGDLNRTSDPGGQPMDGYVLTRSAPSPAGLTVVAGVSQVTLALQTLKLTGASLSFMVMVIVLALCLGWLLARRLTEALAEAERSRAEARAAEAAAEAAAAALAAELEQAARYVESLLPERAETGSVRADWLYRPSVGVGGDAFGYLWLDETRFAFYLLDVCGHGVGAALLATTVMNVIRSGTLSADRADPSAVLAALNDAFPMDHQNGTYFTIWYGVYDAVAQSVRYAGAGQHPAVLITTGKAPTMLKGKGVPIGWYEHVVFPAGDVSVPAGSQLYVFSDGLFEVELTSRPEMLTFEEFVEIILDWRNAKADRELDQILETVRALQGKAAFDDDCALIELSFRAADKNRRAA